MRRFSRFNPKEREIPSRILDQLTYLPYPEGVDIESFSDYDSAEGLNACLYLEEGIVTTSDQASEYKKLLAKVAKFFRRVR